MKVDLSKLVINSPGQVQITLDDIEDFFTLSNVIVPGDIIKCQVRHKFTRISDTGKADHTVRVMNGSVKITEVEYQPNVDEMHLRGVLAEDLGDARVGTFQRILLDRSRPFVLYKDLWDKYSIEELREASDPLLTSSVCAIVLKSGVASICVIGRSTTSVYQTVKKAIPKVRKYGGSDSHSGAKNVFFKMTADALKSVPRLNEMSTIIIASPGFLQGELLSYLDSNKDSLGINNLFSPYRFITTTVANGNPNELDDILLDPSISNKVSDLKAVKQATAIGELYQTMNNCVEKTTFNIQVIRENPTALQKLFVTDLYIRNMEANERRDFLNFQEMVKSSGTDVIIFSSKHVSGNQLSELGGIAAILRYAIVLEENDEFDSESSDE